MNELDDAISQSIVSKCTSLQVHKLQVLPLCATSSHLLETMISCGYINKQGQNNMMNFAFWPERYFTLENNCFSYYQDDTKSDLKGIYRLGKDDTITSKDGVLCLTSTFYKTTDQFGGGSVQKLNMKFGLQKNHDRWYKTLRTIIKYTQTAPHFTGRCFCGNVEWVVFGKCVAEVTCHCVDCSFYQSTNPNVMFTQGNLTVTKGYSSLQIRKSTRVNTNTLRCFCRECHTFCFADFSDYKTVGIPFDRLFVQGIPPLLSRSRPKFHIHYASKRMVMPDNQPKYFDLPSIFGGSGNLVNASGDFLGNDTRGDAPKQQEQKQEQKQALAVANPLKEDGTRQVALVTSGCRGVGLEVCRKLGVQGYRVVVCGRDQGELDKAQELGLEAVGGVEWLVMDPASEASVASAVNSFSSQFEGLDVLVNVGTAEEGVGEEGSHTISSNCHDSHGSLENAKIRIDMLLFSAWRVTRAFTPLLKAATRGSRVVMAATGDTVANLHDTGETSVGSKVAATSDSEGCSGAAYEMAVVAAHTLSVQLAQELKEDGVLVNCASACSSEGVDSVLCAATLAPGGVTAGFFRHGKRMDF